MIWTNIKNIRIKRVISFFVIILFLLFMASDYMQFDFDESFSILIYGNEVVPDNVISNHLKNKQKKTGSKMDQGTAGETFWVYN